MKDNFSTQSNDYVKFRPTYPKALVDYLVSFCENKNQCWDCGTGNGQFAAMLAGHFDHVQATDISKKQLSNASAKPNITYSLQPAEKTNFEDGSVDLVTVAQAAHWFDFDLFNPEVKRVLKPNGIVALFGYGLVKVGGEVGSIIKDFYWNVTKPYWDPERNHIEAKYETIPFPFEEVKEIPCFDIEKKMTLDQLVGYISTWSAVQHYIREDGHSPIETLKNQLSSVWTNEPFKVVFPVFMRLGRKS